MNDLTDILYRLMQCYNKTDIASIILEKGINDKEFLDRFSILVGKIEKGSGQVIFFKDKKHSSLRKVYIISYYEGITEEGVPFIMINEFPLGLKGDKNPVVNLQLDYDFIEDRDNDLEILRLAI